MQLSVDNNGGNLLATLNGQFTFANNQEFKQVMDSVRQDGVRSVALDFGGVDFIDSAGLGMLLLLRDECQHKHIPVFIQSAHGQVEKIFMISKFDQLFSLRSAS